LDYKTTIANILVQDHPLSKEDIVILLNSTKQDRTKLFQKAAEVKEKYIGNVVYLRGLIEFSNICQKNCLYCGIRKENKNINRYNISDKEIIEAAGFALKECYGSIVLQSGEIESDGFTERIENLLKEINRMSNGKLRVTLSCGEQSEKTYQRWFNAGAHRYLLRIETSNRELYSKIHPNDARHNFDRRLECLRMLKKTGYQTGTGVMVGLPFQTLEDLANDLLFMQELDIDMCGLGPYIEHEDTPLYGFRSELLPLAERFDLSLKMIAILRIMMKDINIAAATALQAIDKIGREKAIKVGANILMPNITPGKYRDDYALYQNKPCTDENAEDCRNCIEARVKIAGSVIRFGNYGDSFHFMERNQDNS
jgi:biotin synthase